MSLMKKLRLSLFVAGFLAGVVYVVACGETAQSVAETVANAIDLLFDNTSSELSATTVQAAIDEVEGRVDQLEGQGLGDTLVGTWTGTFYKQNATVTDASAVISNNTLTLNADGTYSCTGDGFTEGLSNTNFCASPISWELLHRALRFVYARTAGNEQALWAITLVDASNLGLLISNEHLLVLTKN